MLAAQGAAPVVGSDAGPCSSAQQSPGDGAGAAPRQRGLWGRAKRQRHLGGAGQQGPVTAEKEASRPEGRLPARVGRRGGGGGDGRAAAGAPQG